MVRKRFVLIVALLLGMSTFAFGDLDIGIPPGTPLEWDKDFPKPVPTPRGDPPATTDEYDRQQTERHNPDADQGDADHATAPLRQPVKPPKMDFAITNLYSYFDILTVDIMSHLQVQIPEPFKFDATIGGDEPGPDDPVITQPDMAEGNKTDWRIDWYYQPEFPIELVWDGVCTCLRIMLHPEVVSVAESRAHLLEIGVPAAIGAITGTGAGGVGGQFAQGIIRDCGNLPDSLPSIPRGRTDFDKMACRLAALELTGGFPLAMDPNYARHIMALGEDGLAAVIRCTKSNHMFLRRNATSALGNYQDEDAVDRLEQLAGDRDPVVSIRALKGLMRRDDASRRRFESMLGSRDQMLRCLAAFALGMIADPEARGDLLSALNGAVNGDDRDMMWACLPALARCGDPNDPKDSIERKLSGFMRGFERNFPGPGSPVAGQEVPPPSGAAICNTCRQVQIPVAGKCPNCGNPLQVNPGVRIAGQRAANPEKVGYKYVILYDMALLARAANGHEASIREVMKKLNDQGLEQGFHKTTWYLVADVLAKLGRDPGLVGLKRAYDTCMLDLVKVWIVRRMGQAGVESDYLATVARSGTPMVGAQAIITLSQQNVALTKEVCQEIVDAYGSSGATDGASAFRVATALQIGGQISAFEFEQVLKACQRAYSDRAYAKRTCNDTADITQANLSVFPPLLETAVLELARTGDPDAVALLVEILRANLPAGSAEAALGLGNFGSKAAAEALIEALGGSAGWTRYCAYKSLKNLSQQDHFVDWIFATEDSRESSYDAYLQWFNESYD